MNMDELVVKAKRPRGEDGTKVFSVRVREDIVDKLDDIAARTGRSRNELVGTFLEFAIARCRIEE